MSLGNVLSGTVSDEDYANLPQLYNPDKSAYAIPGYQGYQDALGGILGGAPVTFNPNTQFRGTQNDLTGYYNQVLAGKTPSVAQMQLSQSMDQGQAALAAQANAHPNVAAGLRLRNLLQAQSQLQGQAQQSAALLRGQEQAAAAQGLSNLATNARAQDIGSEMARTQTALGYRGQQAGIVGQQAGLAQAQTQDNMAYQEALRQNAMGNRQMAYGNTLNNAQGWQRTLGSVLGGAATAGAAYLARGRTSDS